MKTNNIELEVDFIGGQDPLTESEEKALSEFFREKKALQPKKNVKPIVTKKKNQTA